MADQTRLSPETEQQLISRAQTAVSQCNWAVGECAAKWTQKYARGRTDADFGSLVGMSGDQVYQRRRVWETFADVSGDYPALKWSHFYTALNWDDAAECLQWAEENQATVAEMKAWRRVQRGEDLTEEPEAEDGISYLPTERSAVRMPGGTEEAPFEATEGRGSRDAAARNGEDPRMALAGVGREVDDDGSGYAPFRQGAGSPAPRHDGGETAVAERSGPSAGQLIKKVQTAVDRCNAALTPEMLKQFRKLPESARRQLVEAVNELQAKVADLT